MKKFLTLFAIFAVLMLVVSCSGGSKNNDKADTGETVNDEDAADTDAADTDAADSEPAGDNEPGGDTTPDETDSDDADTSSEQNDEDVDITAPEPKPVFPKCSESQTFPCYDSEYKIYWSGKTTADSVEDAASYCKNSIIEGFTGWYLPAISELRTLVRNCDKIAPNGTCPIVDENSIMESLEECQCSDSENYSRFGDTEWLLSATQRDSEHAWGLDFGSGKIEEDRDTGGTIRCAATNLNSECSDDMCLNVKYSSGYCVYNQLFEGKISCSCIGGYEWGGSVCEGPCVPNPCKSIAHSDGVCTTFQISLHAEEKYEFACGCRSGYFWNGSECKKPISLGSICTGQDKCYAAEEEILTAEVITCPSSQEADYFGQDAYYAAKGVCTPHNFINKRIYEYGNSYSDAFPFVIDDNTGLMWNYRGVGAMTWSEANEYCKSFEYPEISGWRLPTPLEMLTIINNASQNGQYEDNFNVSEDDFWTSKEYPQDTNKAYYVDFYRNGSVGLDSKTEKKGAFCIRGMELLKSAFIQKTENGNSVVLDSATNLMWQGTYNKFTVYDGGWIVALKYCENLVYAGYSDWRLPNKNEIASLLNYDKSEAPFSDFPDMPADDIDFWTSTIDLYASAVARLEPAVVRFDRATIKSHPYFGSSSQYVRCVRNN